MLRVEKEQVTFNIFKAIIHPDDSSNYFNIDSIMREVETLVKIFAFNDLLEACMIQLNE